ncbi:glutathione S-transferase family protein [Marinomonas sp. 2405UD68-3]|uniref:glutathione S-transferase family protein n=1 Tax=Marinomonas sp. 2405UD68-3 TaxID=3391835 RepID=UPI0039C8FC93
MKIYDVANFPNPLRVRIALAEKNATSHVTFIPVDLMNGEHRTDAFLAKNPAASVPVLELEDGTFISECTAITEYIDQHFSGPSLTGETAKERAIINMQQKRAESMVLDCVAAYFHHATDGLGPALETYQNNEWGQKQKEKSLNGLAYFNTVLSSSTFLAGETFTIADITLYAGIGFAGFAQIEIPAELTHVHRWLTLVAERPSVKQ